MRFEWLGIVGSALGGGSMCKWALCRAVLILPRVFVSASAALACVGMY